jgi:hypothetical protein
MPNSSYTARTSVQLTEAEALSAALALLLAICGADLNNEANWHGGLGADGCSACNAIVNLRPAAGILVTDHLRP